MLPDDPRHGSNAGYVAGCRETCCKEAHAAYRRGLRARLYLARTDHFKVSALGSTRRIRALLALGWRYADIDRAMGYDVATSEDGGTLSHNIVRQKSVQRATAEKVTDAYERLSMQLGPSDRTRRYAQAKGWPPPLAWDNPDDPTERPKAGRRRTSHTDVDEVVVQRLLDGQRVDCTRAEKDEAMRRWKAAGKPERQLCVMHGWHDGRYGRGDVA